MVKNCVEWGLPEPDFELIGTSLVVTFMKSQLTNEFLSGLGLNDRQIKAIEYLKEYGEIDRKTYCNICKVEKTIAHKELSDLVEKNLIERQGKGRSSRYVLRTRRTISGRLVDDSRIGFMLKNMVEKMKILMALSNPFIHDSRAYDDASRSPKVLNWLNHFSMMKILMLLSNPFMVDPRVYKEAKIILRQ